VHLVLEHDGNAASHLTQGFDAQWNDDGHHVLHTLLTGEADGYYVDYADEPAKRLARCLAEGFVYQGEASRHRGGEARGQPSARLPPTAFVLFLQNHDQVGNRALGERLIRLCPPGALKAAVALLLLSPQVPLIFMGEETGSTSPFLYFTSHNDALAAAVRDGRRREFAGFPAFSSPEARSRIPDPNDPSTFQASVPAPGPDSHDWLVLYRHLLTIRRAEIMPHLDGARAIEAHAIGKAAVQASWRLANATILTIAVNLGADPVTYTPGDGRIVFETGGRAARILPGHHLIAMLAGGAP
jgi:maltooligosyltrehalose trehalohydrolase